MYTPNDEAFEDNLEGFLNDALNVVKKAAGIAVSLAPGGSVAANIGGQLISSGTTNNKSNKRATFSKLFKNKPSYPRSLTKNQTTSLPSTPETISLDPSIVASLKEINNRLKLAEIQREATSEHNSINRQNDFERNVIKKLTLVEAATNRLPLGARRDKVLRIILKA